MRLAIIGLGGAARQMMPAFAAHPEVRICAAADPRAEARARFVRDFGGEAFEDVDAMLERASIDAVYVATPHALHAPHCIAAADRGKHIIVEKPMALTLAECDAMIEAAERNGVSLVVGHTHGFNAPVREAARLIASGELGRLAMIHSWNYNDYLYRPRWPAELSTAAGGGIIFNQVPHQVDIVRRLGGGRVRSVRASAWAHDPARPTEGAHTSFLEFEDGAVATLVMSGYDRFDSDEFHDWVGELGEDKVGRVHGSTRAALGRIGDELAYKRSLAYGAQAQAAALPSFDRKTWHQPHFGVTIASCASADLRLSADGVLVYDVNGRRENKVPPGRVFPNKDDVVDELYEAFTTGRPPRHDGRWGKATLEVCLAILTSSNERREVRLSHQVAARY